MKHLKTILFCTFAILFTRISATTWDEPWQETVIKEADYFVLAKIKAVDEHEGITIDIIKCLGGDSLKGEINITQFSHLDLCSTSGGHGPEFRLPKVEQCYFFIKKNEKGEYCIPTPTSGYGFVDQENVIGTYRHSYHQAKIPIEVYEKTMTAIFNNYHQLPYDKAFISNYINNYLSLNPAKLVKEEFNNFFGQHVALECIYHLRLSGYYDKIIPFLRDTANYHSQISAARALISYNTTECKQELINMISESKVSSFVKVICVNTLGDFKPTEIKEQLIKLKETASTEYVSFGGSIMDPRVCTQLPDLHKALEDVIETL